MKNEQIKNLDFALDAATAKKRANSYDVAVGFFEAEADELREKILNTPNTEELYDIKGVKYYVSANGDDNNDGLYPETPIKSLERINAIELDEGDAILFKRGDTFRFANPLMLKNGVTYGSYGEGAKPKIYGSPENYAENDTWQEVAPNIWKIDFNYPRACGLVLDHSRIVGVLKLETIDNLRENGDYWHDTDNNVFYLYLDEGKPNEVLTDIEIMPTLTLLKSEHGKDLVVDNLCLKYTAGFGFGAVIFKNNLKLTNCEFGFLGGLWVFGKTDKNYLNDYRFGNALEFWLGAQDVLIDNNWFYQTYDSALTWQGNQTNNVYKNIHYTNNLFEYNNCDIEFFSPSNPDAPLENYVMANNIMRFTSMGWGSRTFDGAYRGIEGCIRASTDDKKTPWTIKETYFTNNIIDCPARQTINWNILPEQREGIHASGTKLYIKGKYRTLIPCLQGLQTDIAKQPHDYRFACNYEELVKMFPLFEEGADIYWED
ncbi:MAG: hypothetical protein IJD45_00345 [Clostridia bacterium]|nr:hypothetical protein [Clostridia bacterium]